jgi:hypothetical protein
MPQRARSHPRRISHGEWPADDNPDRGDEEADVLTHPHLKVDAVMMSRVSFQPRSPTGVRAAWTNSIATMETVSNTVGARISPRVVITADTQQPPPGGEQTGLARATLRTGKPAFAKRQSRTYVRPCGVRATAIIRAKNALNRLYPGLRPWPRGWRNHNDHAHADRCAPPGRNPGGGAQWQPY